MEDVALGRSDLDVRRGVGLELCVLLRDAADSSHEELCSGGGEKVVKGDGLVEGGRLTDGARRASWLVRRVLSLSTAEEVLMSLSLQLARRVTKRSQLHSSVITRTLVLLRLRRGSEVVSLVPSRLQTQRLTSCSFLAPFIKSSWVTKSRSSRMANMPASVQTFLRSAPLKPSLSLTTAS